MELLAGRTSGVSYMRFTCPKLKLSNFSFLQAQSRQSEAEHRKAQGFSEVGRCCCCRVCSAMTPMRAKVSKCDYCNTNCVFCQYNHDSLCNLWWHIVTCYSFKCLVKLFVLDILRVIPVTNKSLQGKRHTSTSITEKPVWDDLRFWLLQVFFQPKLATHPNKHKIAFC